MDILTKLSTQYIWLFLVFVRIMGIFIVAPIYSNSKIITPIKILFSLLLSIIVFFTYDFGFLAIPELDINYIAMIFQELMIGFVLGFVILLYFSIFTIAGGMIDTQIGFGMANMFDVMTNSNITVTANLYNTVAMLIFFIINGHYWMIESIVKSYKILPIGDFIMNPEVSTKIVEIFSEVFVLSFKIASPIIAAIFISNIALGFLAKTVPQMNVFVIGMPLKVALGLILLIITTPLFLKSVIKIFELTKLDFLEVINQLKW